jgi:hypothetical protein
VERCGGINGGVRRTGMEEDKMKDGKLTWWKEAMEVMEV